MRIIRCIAMAILTVSVGATPLFAVTDQEMEEARAVTAKAYLRYVNNGSGYLDEVTAKSMSELTPKLKAKEKENLTAFNAVKTPTDYAKWDKKQLVEYWAATFFNSPGLDPNGKAARTRVRKYIEGMTIATTAPKEETPAPSPAAPEVDTKTASAPETAAHPETTTPEAEAQAAPEPEDLLAEQQAIEKAVEESREPREPEQSNTWVYVLVLAILVGIVIWLVIYAANLMKRQPDGRSDSGDGENDQRGDAELREQTRRAIATKNQELKEMQEQLAASANRNAELAEALTREKQENKALSETISRLKEENRQLRLHQPSAPANTRTEAPRAAGTAAERMSAPSTPTAPQESPQTTAAPTTRTIFLGRVNKRGIFVRGDRKFTPGHTIYQLHTNDGLVGTFQVVDHPEVVDLVLSNPEEYLGMGCTGEDLEDTVGVSRITTKNAGTAIFENGYWKVLRKTGILYE